MLQSISYTSLVLLRRYLPLLLNCRKNMSSPNRNDWLNFGIKRTQQIFSPLSVFRRKNPRTIVDGFLPLNQHSEWEAVFNAIRNTHVLGCLFEKNTWKMVKNFVFFTNCWSSLYLYDVPFASNNYRFFSSENYFCVQEIC